MESHTKRRAPLTGFFLPDGVSRMEMDRCR
jgi:hypothetical protein